MKSTMKKLAASLLAILMVIQMVPALGETYSSGIVVGGTEGFREALEIVASKGTLVLVGQMLTLDVNENYMATWYSDDENIAIVDGDGNVTAIAEGTVTITAKADRQSATAIVTVIDPEPLMAEMEQQAAAEAEEPEAAPEEEPEVTPETEPETVPEEEPEVTPEEEPEIAPETEPEVAPETEPETAPETEPETEPEVQPEEPVKEAEDEPADEPEEEPAEEPEEESEEEPEEEPEELDDDEEEEPAEEPEEEQPEEKTPVQKKAMIIVINGESSRHVYDGTEKVLNTFVATSNQDFFDESKIQVNGEIGVAATNCGTYQFILDESNFSYNDKNVIASFVVNNGWMKITPAEVTVTANAISKDAGEPDPELTATVIGLYGEDTIDYTLERNPGETVGEYIIDVTGKEKQGNYRINYVAGKFTINGAPVVTIESSIPAGQPVYAGTEITLKAVAAGFGDVALTYQWQYSTNNVDWQDIEGANKQAYTYILLPENAAYRYRVFVNPVD